jgi:3-(3-hydroxy-phenyl)propionate hydroxylase
MASVSSDPEVLIVGAGPTGLALGCDLARRGIKIRIIDKNAGRTDKSKALGVQAGTLEALSDAFGEKFADAMVAAGQKAHEAFFHVDGGDPVRADLSLVPSPFNFILILPQSETERFLEEKLQNFGIAVERNHKLTALSQVNGVLSASLVNEGRHGGVEEIKPRFVVGCDGAHSAVRHALGFEFKGGAYDGEFVLGDVDIQWPWSFGSVRVFVTRFGAVACFPLNDSCRYRLIIIQKSPSEKSSNEITAGEFVNLAQQIGPQGLRVTQVHWLSRFSVHHRMTRHFRKDHVFLAGDAAHIHSPAGGQGMNTGIQDALNLSEKVFAVLRENKPESILDAYEAERLPVAADVLRYTDWIFKGALLKETALLRFFRRHLVPKVVGRKFIQKKVIAAISEVDVARREINARRLNAENRRR